LLSADFVLNTNDSGMGSLRQTIANAAPGDTIAFATGVTGTIYLTSGSLNIEEKLDIEGPGADSLAIDGFREADTVFADANASVATIAGLTIMDGLSPEGGGILNEFGGRLTVTNCPLFENGAGVGGGIFTDLGSKLTITNSTLSGNSASVGGGIDHSAGFTTLANTIIANNTAPMGRDVYGTVTSLLFTSVPELTSAISSNVVIRPAQASQLVIHTQPSATATAGKAFATLPVVDEVDQYGNLETGDNSTQVTASPRVGTGPLQGRTTVAVSGGIATFTNLADNTAETITLVFTSPGLAKATSNPIIVGPRMGNAQVVVGLAKVDLTAKVMETSQAKRRHAIGGARLPAKTKPHALGAVTQRQRQSGDGPDSEASTIEAVATANRARAVVRADSVFIRVSAELKARLLAYLIAPGHAGSDLS